MLLAREDAFRIILAMVGRFYGEGLCRAIRLPLPELLRWHGLIPAVMRAEHVW